MAKYKNTYISRREQEIMDIIYQLGASSVSEVVERMNDNPSYDSVRVTLGILANKGFLKRKKERKRYIYIPVVTREKASRNALRDLIKTYFNGSHGGAIMSLLEISSARLSKDELKRIETWLVKRKRA